MKKLIAIILCVVMIVTTVPFVWAAEDDISSLTIGEITATLNKTDRTLVFSGTGTLREREFEDFIGIYKYAIKYVDIEDGITRISESFFGYHSLLSFTLPSTLESIYGSFNDLCCLGMRELEFPEGLKSIDGNYVEPDGCLSFSNCSFIRNVYFPSSLKYIGGSFLHTDIWNVEFKGGEKTEIEVSFGALGENFRSVTLPPDTTVMDSFYNNPNLKEVILGPRSGFNPWVPYDGDEFNTKWADPLPLGMNVCCFPTEYDKTTGTKSLYDDYVNREGEKWEVNDAYNMEYLSGAPKKVNIKTSELKEITVYWDAVENIDRYLIYRYDTETKKWRKVATVKNYGTSFTDKTVKQGVSYRYMVVGDISLDGSIIDYTVSDWVELSSTVIVEAPVKKGKNTVNLKWSGVYGVSGYQVIYRAADVTTKKWGRWKAATTSTKKTEFNQTVLPGYVFQYAVRGYIKQADGSVKYLPYTYSTAIVAVGTPTVKATPTKNGAKITWNKVPGANGYRVYYKYKWSKSWKLVSKTTALSYSCNLPLNWAGQFAVYAVYNHKSGGYDRGELGVSDSIIINAR